MSAPTAQAIAWASTQLGVDAITATVGLHEGTSPWRLDYRANGRAGQAILRVVDEDRVWAGAILRAAAGLTVAGDHGLPTARLLALDPDGSSAGAPALLETYLGESAARSRDAMSTAGAALAAIHHIELAPTEHLPRIAHHTPSDDHPSDRRWTRRYQQARASDREKVITDLQQARPWMSRQRATARLTQTPTSDFLTDADERLSAIPAPQGQSFLHGDVWLGNMHWAVRTCNGLLDWKSAGVGHPGVDLGSLRMRATFDFGTDAADEVTAAWEEAAGRRAEAIPYWDASAALHTPYDEDTEPRDAFLDDALHRLR